MMVGREDFERVRGAGGSIFGGDGERIGRVGEFYVDDDTSEPTWVSVKTGLFGLKESLVPLEGVEVRGDGLVVQYTKEQVKDAPRIDSGGHLEPGQEDQLFQHYGRPRAARLRLMTANENIDPIKGDTGSVFDEGGSAYGSGSGESVGLARGESEQPQDAGESAGRGAPGSERQGHEGPKETSRIPGVHDKRRA
ncbi:PRC-barrel domain-containing protein [Sinomonas humi]|uniref:PRC-barrel domain-containing protein n=1 Tax=Sinomonas humi TaxID=1338436 RepID=UPI00068F9711|nr:PRC-barrel domain-containing protein [Sinomonas humi]